MCNSSEKQSSVPGCWSLWHSRHQLQAPIYPRGLYFYTSPFPRFCPQAARGHPATNPATPFRFSHQAARRQPAGSPQTPRTPFKISPQAARRQPATTPQTPRSFFRPSPQTPRNPAHSDTTSASFIRCRDEVYNLSIQITHPQCVRAVKNMVSKSIWAFPAGVRTWVVFAAVFSGDFMGQHTQM